MRRSNRVLQALACACLVGCSAADGASGETGDLDVATSSSVPVPTLEEFVESVHQKIRIGETEVDAYVVEGDMLVSHETLVDYYESVVMPVRDKAVGVTINGATPGEGQVSVFLSRPGFPAIVRYCFDSLWTSAEITQVQAAIDAAAADWEAVAGIDLQYVSRLDGASCTAQQTGKDIRVTKFTNAAQGSFPREPNQILGITFPPPNHRVMLHEIGHIYGLGHEQFHSQSGLNCNVVGPDVPTFLRYSNLTPQWDSASVMQYFNNGVPSCSSSNDARAGVLTAGDVDGMQSLYGP